MLNNGLYVGLSGQMALQRRLDSIANNIANTGTAGFRAEEIRFEAEISNAAREPVDFVSLGETRLSRRVGEMVPTGNPLDVAVRGQAWLSVQTPAGPAYTRDGRMTVLPSGEVQSVSGYPVLDEGGAALLINPNGGPPTIGADGTITQGPARVGRIGLFTIPNTARLQRIGETAVQPDVPAEALSDPNMGSLVQGFVEKSNVNAVREMSNLIIVSRSFDALASALADTEQTFKSAVQTLAAKG